MRVVIRSVNYSDYVEKTLPGWRAMLPQAEIVIATSPDQEAEHHARLAVAATAYGARIHETTAWHRRGSGTLDGGSAADRAFGFTGAAKPPLPGEVCISADADVYPFGVLPEAFDVGSIYCCPQFYCADLATLEAHKSGALKLRDIPIIPPRSRGSESEPVLCRSRQRAMRYASRCLGYFQLWRHEPGLRLGTSKTAGGFDVRFRKKFAQVVPLSKFYVLHLGPRSRSNWRGRTLPTWGAAQ